MSTALSLVRPATSAPVVASEAKNPAVVEECLQALMDRYERLLYGFLVTLVGRDEAADQTQETFLRAYEHLLAGKLVTRSWLYTVAHNLALNHIQRRKRHVARPDVLEHLPEPPLSDRTVLARRSLNQLAPGDREVLYLFVVDRFTTSEIGTLVGISPAAVRQRLCRARERFRVAWYEAGR